LGSSAHPSGTRTTYFTASDRIRRGTPTFRSFYPPHVVPPSTPRRVALVVIVALASVLVTAVPADAASEPPPLALKRIAALSGATAMATRKGDPAIYVTTQDGKVVALRAGAPPTTVLDLTSQVRSAGEQGLLGIVFSPDGSKLYLHYTGAAAGETDLDEYAMTDGRPDPR